MTLPERVQADYEGMNLTTGPHPMKLLREQLPEIWRASDLVAGAPWSDGRDCGKCDLPSATGTAKGFVFISLEDETGVANAIVTPDLFERVRLVITEEPFLLIEGEVQNTDNVVLVKARKIRPLAHAQLAGASRMIFVRRIRHPERNTAEPRNPAAPLEKKALGIIRLCGAFWSRPGTPSNRARDARLVTATTRAAGATDRTNRRAG